MAWVLGTLGLVVVVLIAGTAGYAWYLNHEIHRIDLHNLTSAPGKGADAGTQNILMIGSTSRCRAEGPERRLRPLLPGRQRREQRRRHDPAPQPGQRHPVDPLDTPRPVRAQRPLRRRQQDRRRPLSGSRTSSSPPSRRTLASPSSTSWS